jgi:hypothetical protein
MGHPSRGGLPLQGEGDRGGEAMTDRAYVEETKSLAVRWSLYHGCWFIDLLGRQADPGLVQEFKLYAGMLGPLAQDGISEPWPSRERTCVAGPRRLNPHQRLLAMRGPNSAGWHRLQSLVCIVMVCFGKQTSMPRSGRRSQLARRSPPFDGAAAEELQGP